MGAMVFNPNTPRRRYTLAISMYSVLLCVLVCSRPQQRILLVFRHGTGLWASQDSRYAHHHRECLISEAKRLGKTLRATSVRSCFREGSSATETARRFLGSLRAESTSPPGSACLLCTFLTHEHTSSHWHQSAQLEGFPARHEIFPGRERDADVRHEYQEARGQKTEENTTAAAPADTPIDSMTT